MVSSYLLHLASRKIKHFHFFVRRKNPSFVMQHPKERRNSFYMILGLLDVVFELRLPRLVL